MSYGIKLTFSNLIGILFLFNILFNFLLATTDCKSIVIEPKNKSGNDEEIGVVFVQGARIESERYVSLSNKIQEVTKGFKTWISITNAWFDTPICILATKAINESFASLYQKGLSKNSRVYLIGHSLGGVSALNYYMNYKDEKNIAGLITLGSIPERGIREKTRDLNILVLGGELDGLSRITRLAEEFYHRNLFTDKKYLSPYIYKNNLKSLKFLEQPEQVVPNNSTSVINLVLEGLNHMSFASGEPTKFVAMRDLKAEVSLDQAHAKISELINAFISQDLSLLQRELEFTHEFLKPIISAFELEGSLHFNRPDQNKCHRGYCSKGTEWTIRAQEILSMKDLLAEHNVGLNITNDYVILSSLPPLGDLFHPKMSRVNNTINLSTYSQCTWKNLDKYLDGGFAPLSAEEIGSKMYSRQCSLVYGANRSKEETPLTIDSEGNICVEINSAALKWAQDNISEKALNRFNTHGQKIRLVNDTLFANGFSWTYSVLKWTEDKSTGDMNVGSFTMVTDIDAKPLPIFAPDGLDCYHYCKLLSPARVMEWMYVDGLRKKYHI